MLDLILENAAVMDGTGKEAFTADVGISGERIESIGNLKDAEAARRIDVSGKTVCPGFIDVHSHADLTFFREDHPRLLAPLVEQGRHPLDVMCDLLLEEDGRVLVFESLAEPDDFFTEKYTFPALKDSRTMISTDALLMGMGKPLYLFYGCYPKFIGRYVYEKGLVDLPTAVARCTSLPAEWFGIKDRGEVKEGYFADLLVMRPQEFKTTANFRNPERRPEGMDMVLINGTVVVEDGRYKTDLRPGKMLRK